MEIGISYHFHMSQNIILLLNFFNHLNMQRPFVDHGIHKNRWVGQTSPTGQFADPL